MAACRSARSAVRGASWRAWRPRATRTRPARCPAIPWRWRPEQRRSHLLEREAGWQRLEEIGAQLERLLKPVLATARFPLQLVRVGSLFWLSLHAGGAPRTAAPLTSEESARFARCSTACSHAACTCRPPPTRPVSCRSRTAARSSSVLPRRSPPRWRNCREGHPRLPAHRARPGGGGRGAGRLVAVRPARLHRREGAGGARRLPRADRRGAGAARLRE